MISDRTYVRTPITSNQYMLINNISLGQVTAVHCGDPPAFVQRFREATIYADNVVRDSDSKLHWRGFVPNNYTDFSLRDVWPETVGHTDGAVAFLASPKNFGHILFEGLPRLAMLDLSGHRNLPVVIFGGGRLGEFLDLLRRPYMEVTAPWHFEDVVVPSCPLGRAPDSSPFASPEAVWWIRQTFQPKRGVSGTRLFCRRGGAKHRNIVNDDQVASMLAGYGFQDIDLGTLELRAQIDAVSDAEIIVAAGGAGSGICGLFGRGPVIELWPPHGANTFGAMMFCMTIGLPYERLNGIPTSESIDADYAVPLEKLRDTVTAALRLIEKPEMAI